MERTTCLLCDADDTVTLFVARDLWYKVPGEFPLVRCRACGLVYLNPRPAPTEIGRYYPSEYAPHRPAQDTPVRRLGRWKETFKASRFGRAYAEFIGHSFYPSPPPGGRVLELGCSYGGFLATLRAMGWQTYGVEVAPEPVAYARAQGLNVFQGDLFAAQLPEAFFDVAIAWMVVEHLHDPVAVLHEVRRILKKDGQLLFSVPNFAALEAKAFGPRWFALDAPRHLYQFTPATISRLLGRAGFRPRRIVYQKDVKNLILSVAFEVERLGEGRLRQALLRMMRLENTPLLASLAPLGFLLGWSRQSGRITIIAEKDPSCAA
jgi:SAM-dependent methyltransferase